MSEISHASPILSPAGAELETNLDLGAFASLQVEVPSVSGKSILIDAKVVRPGESESACIIRFTGTDEAVVRVLNNWLTQR